MSKDHELGFIRKYIFSIDHKIIGFQYLLTGTIMGFIGGYLSHKFRMQLAFPDRGILTGGDYNTMVTMHGLIMVLWVAMPILIAAFGNLLIPLMLGLDDMAYPKLNRLSYWIFFISSVVLIGSFFIGRGGFGGGWTLYPPLSAGMAENVGGGYSNTYPGFFTGGSFVLIAIALEIVAFLIGGINFIVTTINLRAEGMTIWRIPFFVWMVDIASVVFMLSVGPLVAGALMLLLDRSFGAGFFDPKSGGDPITFQHLFWFFGHPEVYVVLLPSLGIVGEILATFSRKPLFAYKKLIYASLIGSGLSFIVWAHHQFVAGIDPRSAIFFSITTILISVPFGTMIFSSIATLIGSNIHFSVPMLWVLGFLFTFIIGGVTGIYLGSVAADIVLHDTYFIIAHFHYTFIPILVFAGMAAVYYWYPKFIGRMYNKWLGRIHFFLTFILTNMIFFPLFFSGFLGQQRRSAAYTLDTFPSVATDWYQNLRIFIFIVTSIFLLVQFLWFISMIYSAFFGRKVSKNPWNSNTLEWAADSPPKHGNFDIFPTVYRGPYEYGQIPNRKEDFFPQGEKQ